MIVPRNLRIAAGLGHLDIEAELFDAVGRLRRQEATAGYNASASAARIVT
jgi:hypothetical protein